jgi:RHS repeat-associated protein
VDDNGWIGAITDERGAQTGYLYDQDTAGIGMGRLTEVDYPQPDTQVWDARELSHKQVPAEMGFPANTWRTRITEGRMQRSVYFDERFNPVLEEEKDLLTGTARYTRREFDHAGRAIFQSYPSATSTANAGIYTTFDALGRQTKKQIRTSGALGLVLEQVEYLSGTRRRITDAEGNSTTITYQAFDAPAYERPTLVIAPENQTTTIGRDRFGKITSVTQAGPYLSGSLSFTRSFLYDSAQRLCRRDDPESGSTFFGYDLAGRPEWEFKGQGVGACPSAPPTEASKIIYDGRGRPKFVDHLGTVDDVTYTYFPNGLTKTVTNATAEWSYTYAKRGLLESEAAVVDGRTFTLNPEYTSAGHVNSLTTPGRNISYAPDAWGRPTQVGSFAASIQYHPNGLPNAYALGTNMNYSQTLNARLWPEMQRTMQGGTKVQEFIYSYSNAGDLDAINAFDDADDAILDYDALHRMKSATGLWGSYQYTFDPLNNIRTRTGGAGNLTFAYNATTLLLSGVSGAQTRTYGYNAKGEITGDGSRVFGLNASGQITSAAGATYKYDGNSKRIKTTLPDGTVEYAFYNRAGALVYTFRLEAQGAASAMSGPAPVNCDVNAEACAVVTNPPTQKSVQQLVQDCVQGSPACPASSASAAPATPASPTPGDVDAPGQVTASRDVTLSWQASVSATSYIVEVIQTSNGATVVSTTVTGTSYPAHLAYATAYRWAVRACNSAGCSAPTASRYFRTPAAPAPIEVKTDFILLAGKVIAQAQVRSGVETIKYLHADLLSSPRLATDAAGAELWREHYDPWGMKLNGVDEKIGYTGHAFDGETDFTYMQARFYDPLVGRFLSTDPIYFSDQNPFTFNRYAYANNNPYRYIDPLGLQTKDQAGDMEPGDCAGERQSAGCSAGSTVDNDPSLHTMEAEAAAADQAGAHLTQRASQQVQQFAKTAGEEIAGVVGKVMQPVGTVIEGAGWLFAQPEVVMAGGIISAIGSGLETSVDPSAGNQISFAADVLGIFAPMRIDALISWEVGSILAQSWADMSAQPAAYDLPAYSP